MTNILNTYNFMDLLKDNNYVPETDNGSNKLMQDIESLFDQISNIVTSKVTDYDFMDLLNDKGYVPAVESWIPVASNDNSVLLQAAS